MADEAAAVQPDPLHPAQVGGPLAATGGPSSGVPATAELLPGTCVALRDACLALTRFPPEHPIHRPTALRFAELLQEYARLSGGILDLGILPGGAVAEGEWVYRATASDDPIPRLARLGITRLRLGETVNVAQLADFLSQLARLDAPQGDPQVDWLAERPSIAGLDLTTSQQHRWGGDPSDAAPTHGALAAASEHENRRAVVRLPRLAAPKRITSDLEHRVAALPREEKNLPLACWILNRAEGQSRDFREHAAAALTQIRNRMLDHLDPRALAWLLDQLEQRQSLPPAATTALRRGLLRRADAKWFAAALRALPHPRCCDVAGLLVRMGSATLGRILSAPEVLQCEGTAHLLALLASSTSGQDGELANDCRLLTAAERMLTWLDTRGQRVASEPSAPDRLAEEEDCLEQLRALAEEIAASVRLIPE